MAGNKYFILFFSIIFLLVPFIASASEEQIVEIMVQKGDNLINICKKYLEYPNKWKEVAKINKLTDPDFILPDQIIRIPSSLLKGVPSDGSVSFLKGDVKYLASGTKEWKPLFLNDRVKEGSSIKTEHESVVEIVFDNGDSLLQSENTILGISTARKIKGDQTMYKLFLNSGRTITKIKGATGRESRFQIDTPSAICAARGTVFRTSVDSNDYTRSEVLQGIVDVTAMKQKVNVRSGEGTLVRKGEPPMEPKKLLNPPSPIHLIPIYKNIPLYFEFGKVEGAVSYRVLFSKDNNFKDILKEQVIKPHEPFKIFAIEDGTYFLQSRSIDNLGLEGIPSDTSVIKVRINPIPPFIESPVDKAVYGETSLKLKWLKVPDAVRYHIQIAEDREFIKMIEDRTDISDTEYETGKLDLRTYYFRIGSIAKDEYQGEWSDILSFTISTSTP